MFTDLFNWFDCFDTHTSISDFLADVFSGNASNDILKKENNDEKNELKDSILSKYVRDGKDISYVYYVFTNNKKEIHDKCEEIISSFEVHPVYLDKVNIKICINFPNQKLSFIYKWDKNQKCFVESCESEEKKPVENNESKSDLQLNLNVDGEQIQNPYEKKEDTHIMGKGCHPVHYNFISRYGDISVITVAGCGWNFIDAKGDIMSDDWYDEIEDFRNGYCVARKGERYCIVNTKAERVSDWFIDIDEMTFTDGWCLVKRDDGKYNFINPGGGFISFNWYDQACKFYKGFAIVSGAEYLPKSKGKYNLIDITGKYISPNWFEYVGNFDTFQAPITLEGHPGYIDMRGMYFFPDGLEIVNESETSKESPVEDKKQNESKKDIITDESDERLVFMPKSAIEILKDIVNEKKFNILEDEGIAVTIDELTALDTESDSYADCIDKIIENESLMLDRFCKYAKNTFGFSNVIWRRTNNGNNIIFEFYF